MIQDYISVTEIAGDEVSPAQIERLCQRYYWAGEYCKGKDVLEVACGTAVGAGYLAGIARSYQAGDLSNHLLQIAKQHYGNRIDFKVFDAQEIPCADDSLDVIVFFEAIYYLPQAENFVAEAKRVLRSGGKVLIATANKDLYDFNPSPYSKKYYGVVELKKMFANFGFFVDFFGGAPINEATVRQKILRPIKRLAVKFDLIPKTMSGKKFLKRLVFGKLTEMPDELNENTSKYIPPEKISEEIPDISHQVIYCAATLSK